jgi:hypothetical protein
MGVSVLRSYFARHPGIPPQAEQQRLVQGFAKAVKASQLLLWASGQARPTSGSFLIVGVAIGWNRYDQELLAALDEAINEGRAHGDVVAAFAADALTNATDLEHFIPGLRSPFQSPYVGWWVEGQERFTCSGPSAASFVSDRYGLTVS